MHFAINQRLTQLYINLFDWRKTHKTFSTLRLLFKIHLTETAETMKQKLIKIFFFVLSFFHPPRMFSRVGNDIHGMLLFMLLQSKNTVESCDKARKEKGKHHTHPWCTGNYYSGWQWTRKCAEIIDLLVRKLMVWDFPGVDFLIDFFHKRGFCWSL